MTKTYSLMIILLCALLCATPNEAPASEPVTRHISYSFTLRNDSDRLVPQAEFRTYAPFPSTETQQRIALEASVPFELLTDEAGNQILRTEFKNIAPFGVKILRIEAELLLSDAPQSENPALVNPEILRPEPFCEADDPAVVALAESLKGDNELSTSENIFHWVANNIRYSGYLTRPRGASYALEHRQGDCTEYMYLFVALCRAAGIPARGLGGYVVTRNMALDPAAYHNWAEFYAGGRWRLADPQKQMFDRKQTQYVVMRRIRESEDNFRRFQIGGDGISVEMNE